MGRNRKVENPSASKSQSLKGGEFKREADEVNERKERGPSLEDTDWADLPPKLKEKRQRG